MNNGANDTVNNQAIPGVKVAMPSSNPVDASTADVGASLSNAIRINEQPTSVPNQSQQSVQVTPTILQSASSISPAASAPVTNVSTQQSTIVQPVPTQTTVVSPTLTSTEPVVTEMQSAKILEKPKKEKKPKSKVPPLLLVLVILLIVACGGLWFYHQQQMNMMKIKCTPVSTTGEAKQLDLDSTIVKDLYNKVSTTIREDLGEVELTDQMKLYLAFRQVANSDLYDSNCNKFSATSMEPFICEASASFTPKAVKADLLQVEVKKLFGDDTNIDNQNVQLGKTCIGGYQYIEERGEYVQGQCQSTGATLFRVEKELISATSTESTIVLIEKVKYYGTDALDLPTRLVSGNYKYTFKLDMNYNYIYISKELAS